jgi:SAM-dependent methyltransferase
MEPTEYQTMYSVEDRHWWYVGMQRISTALIERFYPRRTDLHILDAGCGTGAAMAYMAPFGRVVGMDFMELALRFCQQRGLSELAQGSVVKLPFASGQFDLVTSFDVLCHQSVGDYRDTLVELGRVLKPGGRLFLRLPAYNWLRAHHDEVVHTARRFTAAELQLQDLSPPARSLGSRLRRQCPRQHPTAPAQRVGAGRWRASGLFVGLAVWHGCHGYRC